MKNKVSSKFLEKIPGVLMGLMVLSVAITIFKCVEAHQLGEKHKILGITIIGLVVTYVLLLIAFLILKKIQPGELSRAKRVLPETE